MKKSNRSLGRGLHITRERLEKDIEKLKKRLNRIYTELLARQDALKYMDALTQAEAAQAKSKEELLRTEIAKEIEKAEVRADERTLEQATVDLEKEVK